MPLKNHIAENDLLTDTHDKQPPTSGHSVQIRRLRKSNNTDLQTKLYIKTHKDPVFAQMEAAYGALYNLLLGKQAPIIQCVVNTTTGKVIGTASHAIPGFIEYRNFDNTTRDMQFATHEHRAPGLAAALLAAYVMEEEDLHGGNFGLMDVVDVQRNLVSGDNGKQKKEWCKIDHDRSLFSSATHEKLGQRLEHLGSASQKYPITIADINNFPDITDADPYYWVTKNRPVGRLAELGIENPKSFDEKNIEFFKKIGKDKHFQSEKWDFLLQTLLIPEKAIRDAVENNMEKAYQELREQIINHFLARQEALKMTLLGSHEFRTYLASLIQDKKTELTEKAAENLRVIIPNPPRELTDKPITELNNILEINTAINTGILTASGSGSSLDSSSNTSQHDGQAKIRESATVPFAPSPALRKSLPNADEINIIIESLYSNSRERKICNEYDIQYHDYKKISAEPFVNNTAQINTYPTFHNEATATKFLSSLVSSSNEKDKIAARKASYKERILNDLYDAIVRMQILFFNQPTTELGDFIEKLKLIKNELELNLDDMIEKGKSFSDIYSSDFGRIARNIGNSFDSEMYKYLSQNLKDNPINELRKKLLEPLSLAKKEEAIVEFALSTKLQDITPTVNNDTKQHETIRIVRGQYEKIQAVNCADSELKYKAESYLLLRDRLRNDSPANKTRRDLFAEKCALSASEKAKKIGWIVGGVFAVAALITLTVVSCGVVGGVAAAAAITYLSTAALVGAAVGTGVVVAGTSAGVGIAAFKLSKHNNPAKIFSVVAENPTEGSETTTSTTTPVYTNNSDNSVVEKPPGTPTSSQRIFEYNQEAIETTESQTDSAPSTILTFKEMLHLATRTENPIRDFFGMSITGELDDNDLNQIREKLLGNDPNDPTSKPQKKLLDLKNVNISGVTNFHKSLTAAELLWDLDDKYGRFDNEAIFNVNEDQRVILNEEREELSTIFYSPQPS